MQTTQKCTAKCSNPPHTSDLHCQNISSLMSKGGLFQGPGSAPDVQSVLKYFRPHLRSAPKTASRVPKAITSILKTSSPILLLGPHRADTGAGMSIRKLAGFSMGEPSACPRPMPPRQAERYRAYRGSVRIAGVGRIWEHTGACMSVRKLARYRPSMCYSVHLTRARSCVFPLFKHSLHCPGSVLLSGAGWGGVHRPYLNTTHLRTQ